MELIPKDTTLEAYRYQIEVLRKLGPEGRLRMLFDLCDSLNEIVRSGIRLRHPDFDERQVGMAFIRLVHGEEIFQQHFPGVELIL
ncbi:MAG: hypothetical protein NTW14_11375 [bacterium]|nr:hypothetical protein [bacterium]